MYISNLQANKYMHNVGQHVGVCTQKKTSLPQAFSLLSHMQTALPANTISHKSLN